MSDKPLLPDSSNDLGFFVWGGLMSLLAGAVLYLVLSSPLGAGAMGVLSKIFALDSVQAMWYITRASGLTGYFLLWLSTAWGLAVSSKVFDQLLHRTFTYDYHQFLSLLAIGFAVLHILVLLLDRYLPYTLAQAFIPFLSPYRPIWVGIGVIAFYLTLLVTVTFYLRSRIGQKAFRSIHLLSFVAYLGVTAHGLFAGTDSSLIFTQLLYGGTLLVIVFLSTYWLIYVLHKRIESIRRELRQIEQSRRY